MDHELDFDQQHSLAPFALASYDHIRESPEKLQWRERMDRLFYFQGGWNPLQAADLFLTVGTDCFLEATAT